MAPFQPFAAVHPHPFQPRPAVSDDVNDAIASLFLNPLYSDLTIKSRGYTFPCHQNIVLPQIPSFKALLSTDTNPPTITLDTASPSIIARLLAFLYTFNYPDHPCIPPFFEPDEIVPRLIQPYPDPPNLFAELHDGAYYSTLLNLHMYTFGLSHSFLPLARYAVTKQRDNLIESEAITCIIQSAGLTYSTSSLRHARHDAMKQLHVSILAQKVYDAERRLMRKGTDAAFDTDAAAEEVLTDPDFRLLCETHGDFCYDIMTYVSWERTHPEVKRRIDREDRPFRWVKGSVPEGAPLGTLGGLDIVWGDDPTEGEESQWQYYLSTNGPIYETENNEFEKLIPSQEI